MINKNNRVPKSIYDPVMDEYLRQYGYGGFNKDATATGVMPINPIANQQSYTQAGLPNQLQGVAAPAQGGGMSSGAISAGANMVAGLGSAAIDSGGGPGVDELGVQKVNVGADTGKAALKGAATGAAVGSVVPVIGTAIGAGVGAVVGGATGFLGAKGAQKKAERQRAKAIKQAGEFQSSQYAQNNQQQQYAPSFANGGFMDYSGQSHQGPDGGIPVDAQGNPSKKSGQPTVAMTEDGEVNWLKPDGQSYIFSKKLGFSKDASKLMSKYKKKLGKDLDGNDSMANEAMNKQFDNLLNKQEAVRSEKGMNSTTNPQHDRGMETPIFEGGGPMSDEYIKTDADYQSAIGGQINAQSLPYDNIPNQLNVQSQLADTSKIGYNGNSMNRSDFSNKTLGLSTDMPRDPQYTPQLSPSANIVNALGSTADYFIAKGHKPKDVNLGRVSAQNINLGRSRAIARRDAQTSRNVAARNIRGLSGSASQALSNLGSSTIGSQRVLGDLTAKSIEAEELANAKYRQSADSQNAGIASKEALINNQQKQAWRDKLDKTNPLRSVLQQTGQYLTDAEKNRRMYSLAKMYNPNMRINEDEDVTGWQRFMGNRGFTTNYRD